MAYALSLSGLLTTFRHHFVQRPHAQCKINGVEAFLYCQLEGAVGDETVTLARQQSTGIFFLVR